MGLCRVHPISYIILIFVSRIVNQRLSYALPLPLQIQSIIDFPNIHPFLWLLSLWWSLPRFCRG